MKPQINRKYPQNIDFEITNCDFFDGIDRDARDRDAQTEDADWYEVIEPEEVTDVVEYDDTTDRVIETIDVGLYYVAKGFKVGTYYTAYTVAYVVKYMFVAMWWMIVSVASAVADVSRQPRKTRHVEKTPPVVNVTTTVNVEGDAEVNIHTDVNINQ